MGCYSVHTTRIGAEAEPHTSRLGGGCSVSALRQGGDLSVTTGRLGGDCLTECSRIGGEVRVQVSLVCMASIEDKYLRIEPETVWLFEAADYTQDVWVYSNADWHAE